jgi:hypothetical protein
MDRDLSIFRFWFRAASIYNLVWGTITLLFPQLFFQLIGLRPPYYPVIWQCVGMFVLLYALAYRWAAHDPFRFRHLILIGFLGKIFGPIGYIWFAVRGELPFSFGWTILTNDLIWVPVFFKFLHIAAQRDGGWFQLIQGKAA